MAFLGQKGLYSSRFHFCEAEFGPFWKFGQKGSPDGRGEPGPGSFWPKARPQTHPSQRGHQPLSEAFLAFLANLGFWLGWRRGFLSFQLGAGPTGFFQLGQIPTDSKALLKFLNFGLEKVDFKKSGEGNLLPRGHFDFGKKGFFKPFLALQRRFWPKVSFLVIFGQNWSL